MGRTGGIPRGFLHQNHLPEADAPKGRHPQSLVNTLKVIWLTIVQLVRQIPLLPRSIAKAFKDREQQAERKVLEAERLDRLRNPSKYRGK